MSTQQHLGIMQLLHLLVVDSDKTHLAQAVALSTVMHNIAKAV